MIWQAQCIPRPTKGSSMTNEYPRPSPNRRFPPSSARSHKSQPEFRTTRLLVCALTFQTANPLTTFHAPGTPPVPTNGAELPRRRRGRGRGGGSGRVAQRRRGQQPFDLFFGGCRRDAGSQEGVPFVVAGSGCGFCCGVWRGLRVDVHGLHGGDATGAGGSGGGFR